MHFLSRWSLVACLLATTACNVAQAQTPAYPWPANSVVPIFFVPTDWDVNSAEVQAEAAALRSAMTEIHQLYARALDGNTFVLNELIVVQAAGPKEAYGIHWNGGNIYTDGIDLDATFEHLVVSELHGRGYPTPPAQNESGYSTLIFVKGAGGYAGGREFDNADGGWAILGDWAIDSLQGQVVEGEYWWSGRNLQIGAAAHELGHTFGLPHPDAWGGPFEGLLMGYWWEYPNVGFADWENDQLNRNKLAFFAQCKPPKPLASAPVVKPYELVMLPTLGGDTQALHINKHGLIAGRSDSAPSLPHQVLFTPDGASIVDLGAGGGSAGAANAVSDNGVVSGFWDSAAGARHATRSHFDPQQKRWVTQELPAPHRSDKALACDINNSGKIVGATHEDSGEAIVWNGLKLSGKGFNAQSIAFGINDPGQIVGRFVTDNQPRAFLWNDNGNGTLAPSELHNLGVATTLAGADSEAFAINNRGQIVGSVNHGGLGQRFAFRLTPLEGQYFVDRGDGVNALMRKLGRLGAGLDYATDINEQGVAVGRSGTCTGRSDFHAALWRDEDVTDLNDLVTPLAGVTLVSAEGINNLSEIVGYASTPDGVRGFLLRPVVPPAPAVVGVPVATDRSVVLRWEDLSRNEWGFEIERRELQDPNDPGNGTEGWVALVTVAPEVQTYADLAVQPGTTYQYRLRAFNGNGASEYSGWAPVRFTGNLPPVAVGDSYTTREDTTLAVGITNGLLANDTDPNGDALSVAQVRAGPTYGVLQWLANGSFRYTPQKNFAGTDRFEYGVQDTAGNQASAVVSVKVTNVEDKPRASDDKYATTQNTQLCVQQPGVLNNDQDDDNDKLQAILDKAPKHGRVDLAKDGSFCYSPQKDFQGADRFTYFAVDASGRKDTATVSIDVVKRGN